MERISMYIEQEVEASTSFREQKLLVAEFGLLDAQLTTIINMLQDTEVRSYCTLNFICIIRAMRIGLYLSLREEEHLQLFVLTPLRLFFLSLTAGPIQPVRPG